MPTNIYGLTLADILTNAVDVDTNTFNAMLITSGYTPNFDTDHFVSTIRASEVGASGSYAANGSTVALTVSYVTAASATAWTAATAYSVGDIVRKVTTNGHIYRCTVAGTSHATTEPVWTTVNGATQPADNTVTWNEVGRGFAKVSPPASVAWTTATITARYMVIANFTPGTDATRHLLACIDFGSNQTSTAGTFTVTFDVFGLILLPIPF